MPTVTDSDVAAGVCVRWVAVSALNSALPATSVYRGRVAEKTALPYARLRIRERERELTSGPIYLTNFIVDVDCYINTEAGTAGPLRVALDAAFNGSDTDPTRGVTVANATVLQVFAEPGTNSEPTKERLDGQDVVRVSCSFRVYLQASRA